MPDFEPPVGTSPPRPSTAEIRAFLEGYGLTLSDHRVGRLRAGEDNVNLHIASGKQELVLRRYDVTPPAEVMWELELVDRLSSAGFPTAPVVRRRDGGLCAPLQGRIGALFVFVRGVHPRRRALWAGEQVAWALASLGALTQGTDGGGTRSRTDRSRLERLRRVVDTVHPTDPDLPALVEEVDRGLAWYEEYGEEWAALPRGVVHHDAHEDNVLFDGSRDMVALLDFDEAYGDCLLTDVARLLRMWGVSRAGGGIQPKRVSRLLGAYERRRQLLPDERRWLPHFVLLTSLADAAEYVAGRLEEDPRSHPVRESWSVATYRRLIAVPDWRDALPDP